MSERPEPMPDAAEAATLPPPGAPADRPEANLRPVVLGYEILSELGRGGMGVVYQARQKSLNRVVALKVILAGGHAGEDELARFRLEAEALALLRHPNIVQIYEVGTHEGRPFLALEFLEGGSLAGQLEKGTPTPPAAAALVEALARAMHAAHARGIVHRDLKPENVLLDRDGTPKIMDFGLAKRLEDKAGQTASDAVVGTPSYMAPEQAEGKSRLVGPAADVYALGAILYRLLAGRPPFQGPTTMDVLMQVVADEPVPPRRLCLQVPRDLETVCLKCLRKQPGDRYPDALELAEDLRRFQGGEPIRARAVGRAERLLKWARRRPALAAAFGLGVLVLLSGLGGAGAVWLWQRAESALEEATATRDQLAVEKQITEAALEREKVAKDRLDEARRDLERLSYYRAIDLALREWRESEVGRAEQLLQDCPASLRGWEWHHVRRLCQRDLLTLQGHTFAVFSPDGERLATAGGTVKVWDARTGREIRSFRAPDREVGVLTSVVAYSSDGRWLAGAGSGWDDKQGTVTGVVTVWDAQTGQRALTLRGHTQDVHSVAFSPDGRRLASAGGGYDKPGEVKVWDAHTGQEERTLQGHTGWVRCVSFSPDGRRIASASGREVKVWDMHTGQQILSLEGGTNCVSFSPDGRRLATASLDRTVKVWDALTGQEVLTLKGHAGTVYCVSFSPDSRRLASASGGMVDNLPGEVRVWDAQTGQEALSLKGHTQAVISVSFRQDGRRLTTASRDMTVKVWNAHTGQDALTLEGQTGSVNGVAFSPDGRRLASAGAVSRDLGVVKLWDAETGQEALCLKRPTGFWGISFSPDGRRLASASGDGTVKLWDTQTGKEERSFQGATGWLFSVAFSPDGRRLASAGGEWGKSGEVKVWDAQTGQPALTLKGHTDIVLGVSFSPDGRRLASASWDGTVSVWDAQTGRETLSLILRPGPVFGLAYNPDSRRLASASLGGTVKVWDTQTGREIITLKGHTSVKGVAFSPDGRRLASAGGMAGQRGELKVWDAQTGQEALTLKGHTGEVTSVAFSPDGRRLASASQDGTVKIWDATPLPDSPAIPLAPDKP
jgi:WD40 repeat protein/predicted Ser/Thr protein kinase